MSFFYIKPSILFQVLMHRITEWIFNIYVWLKKWSWSFPITSNNNFLAVIEVLIKIVVSGQWWILSSSCAHNTGWINWQMGLEKLRQQKDIFKYFVAFYHISDLHWTLKMIYVFIIIMYMWKHFSFAISWELFQIIVCHLTSSWRTDTFPSPWTWNWKVHLC